MISSVHPSVFASLCCGHHCTAVDASLLPPPVQNISRSDARSTVTSDIAAPFRDGAGKFLVHSAVQTSVELKSALLVDAETQTGSLNDESCQTERMTLKPELTNIVS